MRGRRPGTSRSGGAVPPRGRRGNRAPREGLVEREFRAPSAGPAGPEYGEPREYQAAPREYRASPEGLVERDYRASPEGLVERGYGAPREYQATREHGDPREYSAPPEYGSQREYGDPREYPAPMGGYRAGQRTNGDPREYGSPREYPAGLGEYRADPRANGGPPEYGGPREYRAGEGYGGPPRKSKPTRLTRRGKIMVWVAAVASILVLVVGLGAYAIYAKLDGNLTVTNAFGGLKHRPPPSAPGVQNILILGSQTRDGQGAGFGFDPGTDLSDNLIVVHLDATHTHATVVSIPRDTLVYEPACKSRTGGGTVPAIPQAIIDGAMNEGGPACAVATVEHLTGIRLDHFVRFDFNSFRTMVSVVGGVEVCLPQAVNDPFSHLSLSAGRHLVTGNQALAFVRTRHGVGNGGDLGRIELQQEFMSSLIQKIDSQGTLDNPVKLLQIANSATGALTVDPGLGSVTKLLGMAASLRHLHSKAVTFITMPTILDPANINRLLPDEPQDDVIWQVLKTDTAWKGSLPVPSPRQVQVAVLNGTGTAGLAAQTAASLSKLGFDVVHVGDAPVTGAATTISYPGTAAADGAYAVAQALTAAPASQDNGGTGPITLTIGSGFTGVVPPPTPVKAGATPSAAAGGTAQASQQAAVQTRNAAQNICSGVPGANPNP
jgi:LCP family protein required for cell wall assembly